MKYRIENIAAAVVVIALCVCAVIVISSFDEVPHGNNYYVGWLPLCMCCAWYVLLLFPWIQRFRAARKDKCWRRTLSGRNTFWAVAFTVLNVALMIGSVIWFVWPVEQDSCHLFRHGELMKWMVATSLVYVPSATVVIVRNFKHGRNRKSDEPLEDGPTRIWHWIVAVVIVLIPASGAFNRWWNFGYSFSEDSLHRVAIPLIYDDAADFGNGKAGARLGTEEFYKEFLPGKFEYIPKSLESLLEFLMEDSLAVLPSKVQEDTARFYSAVRALDRYAAGKSECYPSDLFVDAFRSYGFANDWDDNHAEGCYEERMRALACLLDYAVYHAEDLKSLTEFVSDDCNVGVLQYPGATNHCFNLFAVYMEHGRCRVKTIYAQDLGGVEGYAGSCDLTHVRRVGREDDRMYLFSNESADKFSQCLCWYDSGGVAHFFVPDNQPAALDEWLGDLGESEDAPAVRYDPEAVSWTVGSKSLVLNLNGLQSSYHVE